MLAEDNAVSQKVARRFLERMGCDVTIAETGAEAVRLAQIKASESLGDRRQLAHAVHQLGGSSANIHAVLLRNLCSWLEHAALEDSLALLESLVTLQLTEEAARVRVALENITDGFTSDSA